MDAATVITLYNLLRDNGITIWVDGGWSVDALLERETREHKDLDIAVQSKDVPKLREILASKTYKQIREDNKWNFVLADTDGHEIDVHAFIYDDHGNIVDGIMYPTASLKGTGSINGQPVNCITPEYQVQFLAKWVHKWPEKYVPAIAALCEKFDLELPEEYKRLQK